MLNDNSAIKIAIDSVKNHPNHHLEIGIRRSVWFLFGDSESGNGIRNVSRKKRFLLSLMCAEYAKSIYDEYFYDNLNWLLLYSEAISISHAYWNEEIYFDEFNRFTDNFYCNFEDFGATHKEIESLDSRISHKKAFFAMSSMWECLRVSLFDDPFTYEQLEANVKDSDSDIVDYYDYDAAYCAAIAFAGSEWDLENSDREKRLIFWKWWLEEAVSQVLKM